jgi:hypothetical protein
VTRAQQRGRSAQRRIYAATTALRHEVVPSTTAASTPTPTKVRLQSGSGGGRLRSRPAADLGGATSTYSDNRRLLLPLCVANGLLFPRGLDLGLAGSAPFENFLFLKNNFGYRSATIDTKKRLFFVSEKWYRLAQSIPITSYQPIQKTIFVVVYLSSDSSHTFCVRSLNNVQVSHWAFRGL